MLGKKNQVGSSHPLSHGELVRVCRYLVGVEFGGDDCDEVLEHLVIYNKKEEMKLSADHLDMTLLHSHVLLLKVIFSVPSRGLMMPGTSSPKDRWSIRWEKLYTENTEGRTQGSV